MNNETTDTHERVIKQAPLHVTTPIPTVDFGKGNMAIFGVLAGLVITVGLPAVVLTARVNLPTWFYIVVILLSLLVGGIVVLMCAFFGMVLPRRVEGGKSVGVEVHLGRDKKPPPQEGLSQAESSTE